MRSKALLTLCAAAVAASCQAQRSSQAESTVSVLTNMSLEELMQVEIVVRSVFKKPQRLWASPAAVTVITGDEIRRSGARSIPEALRLIPGVYVARVDASTWAISSRGFDGRIANKLLVLVDGRSVYTPLLTGVFWEMQDTVIADIERIEVIRGPGATLWGANAVNGVINVVTKRARDTQGGLLEMGVGTEERFFSTLRYGGRLGEHAWYRVYAKAFERDGSANAEGADLNDGWRAWRTGLQIDWDLSAQDTLTLDGAYLEGRTGGTALLPLYTPPFVQVVPDSADMSGGHFLARWTRTYSETSDLTLQTYYDVTRHDELLAQAVAKTLDVELTHHFQPADRHDIVWGLGARQVSDEFRGSDTLWVVPETATDYIYSALIQDEIELVADRLAFTIGSKFEHNEYTGFEYQPSARLAWTPPSPEGRVPRQTVWAAVSRAVRIPSRIEENAVDNMPGTSEGLFPRWIGSGNLDSEELLAYELGYRVQPTARLTLDLAGFYNRYDRLGTVEFGMPFLETMPPPPHLVLPGTLTNNAKGTTYGVEFSPELMLSDRWSLRGGYALLKMDLEFDGALPGSMIRGDGESPEQIAFLRSSANLPGGVGLDFMLRYVDSIPALDVHSYLELDARLSWRPRDSIELFIVGQNLLADQHREYFPTYVPALTTEVERGVYAGITVTF